MEKYGNFFLFQKRCFFSDRTPVFSQPVLETVSKLQNSDSRSEVTFAIKNSLPYY